MGSDTFGTDYVKYAGYNELAEANNLVILYPQVGSSESNPENPYGCWDFRGYNYNFDGSMQYLTQQGKQMSPVWKMVQDMVAPATSKCDTYTCSTAQHNVDVGACWLRILGDYDQYYVTPCTDVTKPICPMPPSVLFIDGMCEAVPDPAVSTAYPGEK